MKKRSRPKIDRQVTMKCDTSPVAKAESKNKPTDREPEVLHERGGKRPRTAWRSFATIDDDWAGRDRQRGRLKDALLTDREEAMGLTEAKRPEAVAESKIPTHRIRTVGTRETGATAERSGSRSAHEVRGGLPWRPA